jgi:hypothetical protein
MGILVKDKSDRFNSDTMATQPAAYHSIGVGFQHNRINGYNPLMGQLFADTDQAVEDELIARLSAMPPARKLDMVAELGAAVRQLMLVGLSERHPDDTPEQARRRLTQLLYGPEAAAIPLGSTRMLTPMTPQPILVMLSVTNILESLGVAYVVVGSMASALHGVGRATIDVDLLAALEDDHVAPLLAALGPDYYADKPTIREAVARQGSFNLIHLPTLFKVDVFVATPRPFDGRQLQRRVQRSVSDEEQGDVYLLSAEDVVLAKLDWYRLGGGVSDRQWQDILGVLAVQRGRLDAAYLRAGAAELSVADLLERALEETAP